MTDDPFDEEFEKPETIIVTRQERMATEVPADHRRMWAKGFRYCNQHGGWVPASEAHRQFNCPCVVHVCRNCIELDDTKERRPSPEAAIGLKQVKTPAILENLWQDLEEAEDAP